MSYIPALILVTAGAFPSLASASGFEFCDIDGEIQTPVVSQKEGIYDLTVIIVGAAPAKSATGRNDTDCSSYVGERMQISLPVPSTSGIPETGDHILFYRSAVDVFGNNGYAGTSVSIEFLGLRKAPGGSNPG